MKHQKEAMTELNRMRNKLIQRYVLLVFGFAAQLGGLYLLWRHDWTIALAVALVIMGTGWAKRAGG